MSLSGRSRGVVLLVAGIALTASAQLNPTVAVLANASGQVPVECEQGLAPQKMARLDVAQIPEPQTSSASLVAPPSVTLRDTLKAAQTAAEQNDRNDFTNALSRAHSLIASYPSGAERTAATDVIRIFDDVDRIWTYQFESPTGAFFDASNPLFAMLRSYPGYEAAVADDVITTGGTRLYPSHESRTFLLRESSRRLARLGVRSGVQVVERPRREEPVAHPLPRVVARRTGSKAPASKTATQSEPAHRERSHKRKPHPSSSTASTATPPAAKTTTVRQHEHTTAASEKSAAQRAAHHEAVKVADAKAAHEATRYDAKRSTAEAGPKVVPPAPAPTTTAPAGSMTTTTPPPAASSSATTTTASAATSSTPLTNTASTTTAPATASTTASTTSAPDTSTSSTASPTMSDTTATTSTAAAPAQPNRTRSVVLPIILILLGVGVLVVLFRASS
jgi:hypothetical protein